MIRSLEGKLRIGLAEKTLVVALAHAIVLRDLGEMFPLPLGNRLKTAQGAKVYHMTSWLRC